jgi:hypothetical protein
MSGAGLRERLIEDIEGLPEKKVREVIDFVSYLKLKEDSWFIEFVNKRGNAAKTDKKSGRKFAKLDDLQKAYR